MDEFKIIPDAPNYEINRDGVVRNRKTGRVLKLSSRGQVGLYIADGKKVYRSGKRLAKKLFHLPILERGHPIPVMLSNDEQKFYFDSLTAASVWLGEKVYYSNHSVMERLNERRRDIYGWKAVYGY